MSSWCRGPRPRVFSGEWTVQAGAVELIDADVKNGKDRTVPGYLLCRAFLLFLLSSYPIPLISGSWFHLTSLFQVSGSFCLLLSSLLQVQLLLFGCLDPTTVGHLNIHRWPSPSNGKAPLSCLPVCYVFLQMCFQGYKLNSGAQLPLTVCF